MKTPQPTIILTTLCFLVISAILVTACAPQNITLTSQPERNVLSVSGEGQFDVNPDKVELLFSIVTNSSTALDAQSKNRVLSNDVVKALTDAGIKPEDIETQDYDLHPLYAYREKTGERIDQGYELEHRMKVTSKKIEEGGSLADTAVKVGANRVESISFGLTHELERQAKTEALTRASKEASVKAQAVAGSIAITLGKVVKASESASYENYFPPYAALYAKDSIGAAPSPTMVSPKKLTVRATVNLDYEIK